MLAKELAELLMKTPDMMVFCISEEVGIYYNPTILIETVEDSQSYEMYNDEKEFIPEEGMKFIVL